MADPLSITASIIALLQLSAEVVGYVISAAGAKQERNKILVELRSCEQILQNLAVEADDPDERQRWSGTIRALEAPDAPLGCLTTALTAIRASLQPKDGVARKLLAKVKWPFQEKEILKIVAVIERQKGLLLIALANDSRKLSQGIKKVSKENSLELANLVALLKQTASIQDNLVNSLAIFQAGIEDLALRDDNKEIRNERRKIHDWLTPIDYTAQQHDYFSRRQAGTGQWLLDSPEFQAWTGRKGQTLCCPGIPGAGKTILASVVIDYLTSEKVCNADTGLAYIYNNFRVNTRVEDLYASLLKQLCAGSTQSSVHDVLKRKSRFSAEEIFKALEAVASIYSRVYIVVDALDECHLPAGERIIFLSQMFKLQTNTGAQLFATSRPIPDIIDIFQKESNVAQLEIRATEEDVRRYLQGQLFRLPSCVGRSKELQEHIKTAIVEAVQGMFLLAQLHVESLIGKKSPKAVKTALTNLAVGSNAYDYAYNSAMERVEGQTRDQEQLAKQVLSWITCAERPLTTLELQHALAVEVGETELDLENLPEVEDMVSVCVGLVTIDKESNIIRLVHYTTQQYFERTQAQWFPDAESEIATTCLTYLSFDDFNTGRVQDEDGDVDVDELRKRLRIYPCYEYASRNWGHHFRRGHTAQSPPDQILMEILMEFLENEKKVEASGQLLWSRVGIGITAAHLAACFGLEIALKELSVRCDSSLDASNSHGRTPLSWAAGHGRVEVVEFLLSQPISANINSIDTWGRSPLAWAALEGHEAVVEVLLGQPEIRVNDGENDTTPLSLAARNGQLATMTLLMGHKGINLNLPDQDGINNTLTWAAFGGSKAIVEMLLNDTRLDMSDHNISRALAEAAQLGHADIVELLLDRTEIDSEIERLVPSHSLLDDCPMSVLSIAAAAGEDSVVGLLLGTGRVDVNSRNSIGRSALSYAAESGYDKTVGLLLTTPLVDVDARDDIGRTPLMHASMWAQLAAIDLLIEHGADFLAVDNDGHGMLHHAFHRVNVNRSHSLEVVRRFLVLGVPASVEDSAGMTPLHYAVMQDHLEVAELLLQHGVPVDIAAQGSRKETSTPPLTSLVSFDKTLGDGSSQASTAGEDLRTGLTPLHYAALAGNPNMVRFLLDQGANPNMPSLSGRTPLCLALSASLWMPETWLDPNMLLEAVGGGCRAKRFVPPTYGQFDDWNEETHISTFHRFENRPASVKALLDHPEIDVNTQHISGHSALHHALHPCHPFRYYYRSFQVFIEMLINSGADPSVADKAGMNALHYAALDGDIEIMASVVGASSSRQADLCLARDNRGRTPLHYSALGVGISVFGVYGVYGNSIEAISLLLHAGSDISATDLEQNTPLGLYRQAFGPYSDCWPYWRADTCRCLLSGKDPGIVDSALGYTVAHAYASGGDGEFTSATLKAMANTGVNLSATDRHGQNILHHAARSGSITEDTLTFILENTTLQIEATDADGMTPATLAYGQLRQRFSMDDAWRRRTWVRTLDIFLKHGARIGAEELGWVNTVVKTTYYDFKSE